FLHAFIRPVRVHPDIPTFVNVEVLFLLFCFLLFFQSYQFAVLGLAEIDKSRFVANVFGAKSNQGIALSTVGVAAFYLGAKWRTPSPGQVPLKPSQREEDGLAFLPHLTLLALAGLIALYQLFG